jgi:hypothetical protein
MRLWRLRSRIKIFTRIFDAAPQHLLFLNRFIFITSVLAPELNLFTAPAEVKGCGSGRTEWMRLRPH